MKNQGWIQKLWIVSVFALLLSGCRFGNYADSPTQNVPSNITHSELFFTQVTGFETYVFFNDSPTPVSNTSSPLAAVPLDILSVFTNPVYWDTYADANQTQFFIDSAQSANPFITQVDASGQINVKSDNPDSPTQFFQNPDCLTQIKTMQNGAFDRTTPGTTVLPGTSNYTNVSGHLKLDITSIQSFSGDCADDLQELANCFQDGTGCDSDQLTRAQMFSLFVNDSHILNISDASKIIGLAYIVHYE